MPQVYKQYNRRFLLEPTKLTRIVDTIHGCIDTIPGITQRDDFHLFLKDTRREELSSIDDVLAADNSRKHRIEMLAIHCSAGSTGVSRPEYEVQVDFGGPSNSQQSSSPKTRLVAITVKSDNSSWNSRTLSQVEEQVERTWIHHTTPLALLIVLLVGSILFLTFQFVSFFPSTSATWWLNRADRERLIQMLKEHPILTDEDLREIGTRQLKNVLRDNGALLDSDASSKPDGPKPYFLAAVIVAVIVCIIVLFTCYPATIFLWGDEKDRYDAILQRRKVVWGILISGLLAGVISKVWFDVLSKVVH